MKHLLSIVALLCLILAACGGDQMANVSYGGVNHTDKNIVSFLVNGEGGVVDVVARGGGGKMACCVAAPNRWHPGLKVTIKWQEDATPVRDEKGNRVYNDGVPVLIEAPWKERTVEVPEYKEVGMFFTHFYPSDEVKVVVSTVYPNHPDYPIPYPQKNLAK